MLFKYDILRIPTEITLRHLNRDWVFHVSSFQRIISLYRVLLFN